MADENVTQTPAPDFAGYSNSDELARGYRASSQEAKRLAAENQRLQEAYQSAAVNQRQDIPNRTSPSDRLAEFGIPADALNEFVNERVGQALRPLAEGFQARGRVLNEYPDYQKYEADVANFVNADPDFSQRYARMFSADPVAAMELAFLKFGESKRKSAPAPNAPNAQEMADASLPGGRAGDSRRTEQSGQNEIAEAFSRYQKSGSQQDAEAFAKLRIRQSIPGAFYDGMG
jgi:hypothetical protein